MADSPTPPKTFSLGSLVTTRKGFSVLVASIVGSLYALAMTVSYFQGKFLPDVYFSKLERAGAGVMAAWGLFTWSATKEDVAAKSVPAAGSSSASVTVATPAAASASTSTSTDDVVTSSGA